MSSSHPYSPTSSMRGPRIMFYGHDSFGLGHLRRCLTLADSLRDRLPDASILIVTGSPCATQFPVPEGVDVLKLPSVTKEGAHYVSLRLGFDMESMLRLRSKTVLAAFESFEPDLLLVDHTPIGLRGELQETLASAKQQGIPCVLGLRDVIDSPLHVAREWSHPRIREALAESYQDVLVYGDTRVFDMRREYPVPPELRERVHHVGYVVRPESSLEPSPGVKEVLFTTGGGGDGLDRIEAYLRSLVGREVSWRSRIVIGPLADDKRASAAEELAARIEGVSTIRFDPDLRTHIAQADVVVAMAGYNTCAEILASGKPAVLLPRTTPRREQFVRATRLKSFGVAECLVRSGLTRIPETVQKLLDGGLRRDISVDLGGAERTADIIANRIGAGEASESISHGGQACNR